MMFAVLLGIAIDIELLVCEVTLGPLETYKGTLPDCPFLICHFEKEIE